jgi:4-amino-4-deoxy-L-arabinose transferase-like glycosyltransferase
MKNNQFGYLFFAISLAYLAGMMVNIMDVDASQYASMSREMLESGSYLQIYEHGRDYLDKPPLLFWLSSLSMSVFGATNFAYKFPSFLFALIAIYSTYRFAQLFYSERIAQVSALVLASSQALFTITNDCRTDTLLMGCVAFTFWQLAAAFETSKNRHFLLGFIGIGLGLLSKGMIAIVIPALAFSVHFIYKKEYKNFIRSEYVWGLLVIALILLPMCIGLYQQFDGHPEKLVNGKTGVSGLRFFFWIQSFGRITGENEWRNAVYFTFLFENMLWSFIPWILLFIMGYLTSVINLFKKNPFFDTSELITVGGFTLGYISLASSKYQLPHYIFVLYPLAAVITARFIVAILEAKSTDILSKMAKILRGVHWFILSVLWVLPFLILVYVFPDFGFPLVGMAILTLIYLVLSIKNKQLVHASVYTAVIINLFLSLYFYPKLLTYQVGSEVGELITAQKVPNDAFFTYKYNTLGALHFYSRRLVQEKKDIKQVESGNWLLLNKAGLTEITNAGFKVKIIKEGNSFYVSTLTPTFLNNKTRLNATDTYYVIQVL